MVNELGYESMGGSKPAVSPKSKKVPLKPSLGTLTASSSSVPPPMGTLRAASSSGKARTRRRTRKTGNKTRSKLRTNTHKVRKGRKGTKSRKSRKSK